MKKAGEVLRGGRNGAAIRAHTHALLHEIRPRRTTQRGACTPATAAAAVASTEPRRATTGAPAGGPAGPSGPSGTNWGAPGGAAGADATLGGSPGGANTATGANGGGGGGSVGCIVIRNPTMTLPGGTRSPSISPGIRALPLRTM